VIGRVESEYVWSLTRMEIWLDGSTRNCRIARNRHVDIHKHAQQQHRQRVLHFEQHTIQLVAAPVRSLSLMSCRGTLATPLHTG
jgi:hypothetical protein